MELVGVLQAYIPGTGKQKVELRSIPMLSHLMTMSDNEKSLNNAANGYQMLLQLMFSIKKINLSFSKEDNVQCGLQQNSKSCSQGIVIMSCFCFLFLSLFFPLTQHVEHYIQNRSFSLSTEHRSGNLAFIDSTPKWKVLESVIHRGKRPLRML
ncbi:hypothetical protein CFP56_015718 [Quercus suber]|uniref:Uncharacterized protein n=1 Tax=Quercus suber TaxID=58331 RepID=A0AAW0KPL1_QUESU